MIVVKQIRQTCSDSPSQWEGTDQKGNQVYIRYRWGHLIIELNDKEILDKQLGSHLDGRLTFEQLKEATADLFAWSEEKTI